MNNGFCDFISSYSLAQQVRDITDDAGGTVDVVCTRNDLLPLTVDVDVIDIGLSDHRMLRWQSSLLRPPPVYVTMTSRRW